MQGLVDCLGFKMIYMMCEKLIDNFDVWTSDFPDLVVWNSEKKSVNIKNTFVYFIRAKTVIPMHFL